MYESTISSRDEPSFGEQPRMLCSGKLVLHRSLMPLNVRSKHQKCNGDIMSKICLVCGVVATC